jgi:trehalose 6-phosphate phosphatase
MSTPNRNRASVWSTSSGTITVPPPTPNRPLKSPAAVPIEAKFRVREASTARHTRRVTSALHSEALAPLRAHPDRAAILLDIDGTLSPIVENASDAHVPEATRQLLIKVARRYRAVACVSGRQATLARAMVGVGTITYLGSHGAELLRPGWTEAVLDPGVEDWVRRIQEFGREADTSDLRRRRVRIEEKGPIVAFHWRGARDEEAARAAIDALAARAESAGLRTHWGRKVLEVRPPVRIDKGAGISSFLDDTDGIENALYVGDDATDLDAFRTLVKLVEEGRLAHGIRVGVSSEEGPSEIVAEADIVVEGPGGVQELLGALATEPGPHQQRH